MGNGLCAQPEDLEVKRCNEKTHIGQKVRKCANQDKEKHALCESCSFKMNDGKEICKGCWVEINRPKKQQPAKNSMAALVGKKALKNH